MNSKRDAHFDVGYHHVLYDPSRQKIAYLRFYTDRTARRLSLKYHECNILLKRNSLQLVKVIKYFENNNIEL